MADLSLDEWAQRASNMSIHIKNAFYILKVACVFISFPLTPPPL